MVGRRRRTLHRLLRTTIAVGLGLAAAGPAYAAPPPVRCGATLTADTVLTRDLRCARDGLTLAPGVDLDLGGHRLVGDGTGIALTMVDATSNSVTGGVIRNWRLGIDFTSAAPFPVAPLRLTRLTIESAPLALAGAGAVLDRVALRRSPISPAYSTLELVDSTLRSSSIGNGELNQIVVRRSAVVGGTVSGDENNTVRVEDSVLDGTGFAGQPLLCAGGSTTIVRSVVKNYPIPLLGDSESCPLTITDSTFRAMPNGAVGLGTNAATITGSTFVTSGVAVRGTSLTVRDSLFSRNTQGLVVEAPAFAPAAASVVTGNRFADNTGNGLTAETPAARLGANRAVRNGGYGIYAPGAVDLGGNRASGNAAGQCVGVACSG